MWSLCICGCVCESRLLCGLGCVRVLRVFVWVCVWGVCGLCACVCGVLVYVCSRGWVSV